MECKIFYARNRKDLEEKVNEWLQKHPVTPDSMRFQFTTVKIEDSVEYILEHTLIVFFTPLQAI